MHIFFKASLIVVLYTGYILAILSVIPRHKVQAQTWTRALSHCEGTLYLGIQGSQSELCQSGYKTPALQGPVGHNMNRELNFYPAQYSVLGWVSMLHFSLSVCQSVFLLVTIFLLILLLTLNYHSPPLYASLFILLKPLKSKHWRRDQLGPV